MEYQSCRYSWKFWIIAPLIGLYRIALQLHRKSWLFVFRIQNLNRNSQRTLRAQYLRFISPKDNLYWIGCYNYKLFQILLNSDCNFKLRFQNTYALYDSFLEHAICGNVLSRRIKHTMTSSVKNSGIQFSNWVWLNLSKIEIE